MIECACPNNDIIFKRNQYGYVRKYAFGHQYLGKKFSYEHKKKMSENSKGKNSMEHNNNWKGNDVGYIGLHMWVRRHLPKPELCEFCNKRPIEDLANITGIYDRNFDNWKYLCTKCHLRLDIGIPSDRKCFNCNSNETYVSKKGYALWRKIGDYYYCYKCS